MFTIQVSQVSALRQIDDFPAQAERSVKGAIYFHPGAVKDVTADEWAHIQKAHPDFSKMCTVLVAPKPPAAPAPAPELDTAAPAEAEEAKPAPSSRRGR